VTYLDTNVIVDAGLNRLRFAGKEAHRLLNRGTDFLISPMVLLEIEYLREIGRIRASRQEILTRLEKSLSLRVCDLPFEQVALQAAAESWTRDPFDRIIVAQARLAKAALITRDAHILANYNKAVG
jgi:PIN domain nuclease of toxin-antitoxin system